MKAIYFEDTDTLVFDFSDEEIVDYVDLDSETLLELDRNGNPVALTIEFARKRVSEQVGSGTVWDRESPTVRRLHFRDTDTLLFEFGDTHIDGPIDHVDLDHQTSLEFDSEGNLVALTIEHAKERGLLAESATEQVPA